MAAHGISGRAPGMPAGVIRTWWSGLGPTATPEVFGLSDMLKTDATKTCLHRLSSTGARFPKPMPKSYCGFRRTLMRFAPQRSLREEALREDRLFP